MYNEKTIDKNDWKEISLSDKQWHITHSLPDEIKSDDSLAIFCSISGKMHGEYRAALIPEKKRNCPDKFCCRLGEKNKLHKKELDVENPQLYG